MKRLVAIALGSLILLSCGNNPPKQQAEVTDKPFFPLASYINDQVRMIDSPALPVSKVTTVKGKSQYSASSVKELREAANALISPDITLAPLKKKYQENSFADQSIPSITLSYSSSDKSLPVLRLDVILRPDPVENDRVRNLYLEKLESGTRTKYLWNADANFQIITNTSDSSARIVKFDWSGAAQ